MTIPSPSAACISATAATPSTGTIYPKLDDFYRDLGQTYRKAVRAFADAGCRYLQLDEVFIAYALRSETAGAGEGARRRSGQARRALCAI